MTGEPIPPSPAEIEGRSQAAQSRWRPYPKYKDSGVEWLGEIPARWNVEALKRFAPFVSRGNSPDYVDESSIKVINQACIYWDGLRLENVKYQRETEISGWKGLLHQRDLLINSTGTGTLGRAAIFDKNGIFIADGHVTIVRVDAQMVNIKYIYYLIQTPIYQGYIYSAIISGSTNQIELSREGLHSTPIICPPLPEQHAIAAFLDRETAKIDALIEKKRRLISLLEEKRAAIISHAVTKGLDPDTPMKDSGIPSVGQIPKHWETRWNKRIFEEIDDRSTTGNEELLTVSHITGITPRSEKNVNMFMAESMEGYKLCQKNDLVINTMWAWMGALGITQHDGIVSPSYNVYRLKKEFFPRYLDFLYRTSAYVCEITRHSKGIWKSRLRLYPNSFFEIHTLDPPLSEQCRITAYISEISKKIDIFIDKLNISIEKLQEYRTALISAAVTGKIDVREASL